MTRGSNLQGLAVTPSPRHPIAPHGKLNFHWGVSNYQSQGPAVLPFFETVTDLREGAKTLARWPYGVIELSEGQLRRVVLRPLPKIISVPEILLLGGCYHRRRPGDRIWLYYNQPRSCRNFLVLKYVVSARQTTMKTFCRSLAVLDEIARLKQSDALLCDASNGRISTKLIGRWGWQPHCPSRWHRHYIKRFYGKYPEPATFLRSDGART